MAETAKRTRGAVAPGKRQVNWRIREDLLEKLQAEAQEKQLKTQPKMLEFILQNRYYPEPARGR